jgi:hypothetical protein
MYMYDESACVIMCVCVTSHPFRPMPFLAGVHSSVLTELLEVEHNPLPMVMSMCVCMCVMNITFVIARALLHTHRWS